MLTVEACIHSLKPGTCQACKEVTKMAIEGLVHLVHPRPESKRKVFGREITSFFTELCHFAPPPLLEGGRGKMAELVRPDFFFFL